MSKHPGLKGRTKARARAADTLYEAAIKRFDTDRDGLRGLAEKRRTVAVAQTGLPDYAYTIVCGVADNLGDIDNALATHSLTYTLDRMAPLDLAILRVACWEIMFNDDVDDVVAISEAMTVARTFSSPQSLGFINGVLDALRRAG